MRQYRTYMDRQQAGDDLHRRLLTLNGLPVPVKKSACPRWAALAACCALLAGIGMWRLLPAARQEAVPSPSHIPAITQPPQPTSGSAEADDWDARSFTAAQGSGNEESFFNLPFVAYPDLSREQQLSADIMFPEGSYTVALTKEEICLLLWGGQSELNAARTQNSAADVPWALSWDGYTITGSAMYDGTGNLYQVFLSGTLDDSHTFRLTLAPGRIPPTCIAEQGAAVTEVNGVAVSGWLRRHDRGGTEEWVYSSELLTNGVGLRFESFSSEESLLSPLFVRWAAEGHLTLSHMLVNDNIPPWRNARFATLEEARQETDFTSFLPAADFPGYPEFEGHLSYQQGSYNDLSLRWSRGMDDVSIIVSLPEGSRPDSVVPVDVTVPESYDVRLYSIPWADEVPYPYRLTFSSPTFRAQDMSRELVAARAYTPNERGDTNSLRISFQVLHENGTLVRYSCEGLTVDQVWAAVEATLTAETPEPTPAGASLE